MQKCQGVSRRHIDTGISTAPSRQSQELTRMTPLPFRFGSHSVRRAAAVCPDSCIPRHHLPSCFQRVPSWADFPGFRIVHQLSNSSCPSSSPEHACCRVLQIPTPRDKVLCSAGCRLCQQTTCLLCPRPSYMPSACCLRQTTGSCISVLSASCLPETSVPIRPLSNM